MEEDNYPKWLADYLLNNSFKWGDSRRIDIARLFEYITLHDSYWYSSCIEQKNSWVLVINLDAIWNADFCHGMEDWPFLIVRFNEVLCTFQEFGEYDLSYRTIGNAETVAVKFADFKEWVDYAEIIKLLPDNFYQQLKSSCVLSRTDVSTVYGGALTLVHAPEVEILLFTEKGLPLEIKIPH